MKILSFSALLLLFILSVPNNTVLADISSRSLKLMLVDSALGEPYESVRISMLAELKKRGFVQGQNLEIGYYSLGNFSGPARHIWVETKNQNYDILFITGTTATIAFKDQAFGSDIPVVFAAVTDPVGIGVINSINEPPKSNFTGVSYPVDVEVRLRFIQQAMPQAKKIGLIYAEMPQSKSYNRWLKKALKKPEFRNLEVIFQSIPYVKSEGGHFRMVELARQQILKLNPIVDLFISPNDQMGVQPHYAKMVYDIASKPLVGIGRKDVMDNWGATMSIYPSLLGIGERAARMVASLAEGRPVAQIYPEWAETGITFDLEKMNQFKLPVPADLLKEAGSNVRR